MVHKYEFTFSGRPYEIIIGDSHDDGDWGVYCASSKHIPCINSSLYRIIVLWVKSDFDLPPGEFLNKVLGYGQAKDTGHTVT